jgi:hypothetical protein
MSDTGASAGLNWFRVSIEGRPLTAPAALAWNGDLPRELQQILFDTAACALTGPGP